MLQLALVKTHLRVDHDLDDVLIDAYIAAAYERIAQYLNRKIIHDETERTAVDDVLCTKLMDLAALKLVGHFYAYRELSLAAVPVLSEFEELLHVYRMPFGEKTL